MPSHGRPAAPPAPPSACAGRAAPGAPARRQDHWLALKSVGEDEEAMAVNRWAAISGSQQQARLRGEPEEALADGVAQVASRGHPTGRR